jgi:hypothetical protein
MFFDWDALPDDLQLTLSRAALSRAVVTIATQAEVFADEIECGNVADRGGAEALRLFAAVIRIGALDELPTAGRA